MVRVNLFKEIATTSQRQEILDWYHLKENLYKVCGSRQRIKQAEALLWRGRVDDAGAIFDNCHRWQVVNFRAYLKKHRLGLVDYETSQELQPGSIGSPAVESAVKQIGRRLKVSGAQCKFENVSQMLQLRCAYLNGEFTV